MSKVTQHFGSLAELAAPETDLVKPLWLQTILLFGDAGTGKSLVAVQFGTGVIYADLEMSLGEVHAKWIKRDGVDQRIAFPSWATFTQFVESVLAGMDLGERRTLIIDTVDELWLLCKKHILASKNLKDFPDNDYGRTLTAARDEFKARIRQLIECSKRGLMGTVLIAHEISEDVELLSGTVKLYKPTIDDSKANAGSLFHWLPKKPEMVLRAFQSNEHPQTGVPFINDAGQPEAKFLLQAKPVLANSPVKDRSGRLPAYVGARYEVLEQAYNKESK